MAKRDEHDPNSTGYTNALLEDIDEKFQTILEATEPIPRMQSQIGTMQSQIGTMQSQIGTMQSQITDILEWKENVGLIPTIFEEVGALRKDVEIFKEAMRLLGRHDEHLQRIEQRLSAVEQRYQST